ncbi:MAG: hypothetical protein LC808_30255 [Actinobacteria bacterium]|nr:hypothetical protein [Actinomycetota bacterium]
MNDGPVDLEETLRAEIALMRSPERWPRRPYLRVERRFMARPGQPLCYWSSTSSVDTLDIGR